MYSWLIIDGYNIISKWPDLAKAKRKSIEFAREKLNTIIQKYSDFKEIEVTIVYDGKGGERELIKGNPSIIFSKSAETADAVIEYLVYNNNKSKEITVATDDNVQRNFVICAGANCISAEKLMNEVKQTLVEMRKILDNEKP